MDKVQIFTGRFAKLCKKVGWPTKCVEKDIVSRGWVQRTSVNSKGQAYTWREPYSYKFFLGYERPMWPNEAVSAWLRNREAMKWAQAINQKSIERRREGWR